MAKKLCINVHMFDMNQDIFIAENGAIEKLASVPANEIGNTVYSIAKSKDIEEIEVNGNQNFIQQIGYEILEELEKLYSNENVRVKLNGEVFNK